MAEATARSAALAAISDDTADTGLLKTHWHTLHEQKKLSWFLFLPPDNELDTRGMAHEGDVGTRLDAGPSAQALRANNDSLRSLLSMRFPRFLSYVVFDKNLRSFLDSFLRYRSRVHESTQAQLPDQTLCDVARRVLVLYSRLVDADGSRGTGAGSGAGAGAGAGKCMTGGGFLSLGATAESAGRARTAETLSAAQIRAAYGSLLYDNWVLDAPKLLDLCSLFGRRNAQLVRSILEGTLQLDGRYKDDLREAGRATARVLKELAKLVQRVARMPHGTKKQKQKQTHDPADLARYALDISATVASVAKVSGTAARLLLLAPNVDDGSAPASPTALPPLIHEFVWLHSATLPLLCSVDSGENISSTTAGVTSHHAAEGSAVAAFCRRAQRKIVFVLRAALLGGHVDGDNAESSTSQEPLDETFFQRLHATAEECDAAGASVSGSGSSCIVPQASCACLLRDLDKRFGLFANLRSAIARHSATAAQNASIAAASAMLPPDECEAQLAYLQAAVSSKGTAGEKAKHKIGCKRTRKGRGDAVSGLGTGSGAGSVTGSGAGSGLGSGAGAGTTAKSLELAPPAAAVAHVQELFPDLGDGFIHACLRACGNDPERVVNSVLEGTLPAEVAGMDRSAGLSQPSQIAQPPAVPTAVLAPAPAPAPARRPASCTSKGRVTSAFDGDEFDTASFLDPSRVWQGKKRQAAKYDAGSAVDASRGSAAVDNLRRTLKQYSMEDTSLSELMSGAATGPGGASIEQIALAFAAGSEGTAESIAVSQVAGGAGEYDDEYDDQWDEEGHWGVADSGGTELAAIEDKREVRQLAQSLQEQEEAAAFNDAVRAAQEEGAYWQSMRNTNRDPGVAKKKRTWAQQESARGRGRGRGRFGGRGHGADPNDAARTGEAAEQPSSQRGRHRRVGGGGIPAGDGTGAVEAAAGAAIVCSDDKASSKTKSAGGKGATSAKSASKAKESSKGRSGGGPASNPSYGGGMSQRQKNRSSRQKASRANHNRKAGQARKFAKAGV